MKSLKAEMDDQSPDTELDTSFESPREDPPSGIRQFMRFPMQTLGEQPASVVVIFRGTPPIEPLVALIRQWAGERRTDVPLRVEIEHGMTPRHWQVRLRSERGEVAVADDGPYIAVVRAFAMLQQALH